MLCQLLSVARPQLYTNSTIPRPALHLLSGASPKDHDSFFPVSKGEYCLFCSMIDCKCPTHAQLESLHSDLFVALLHEKNLGRTLRANDFLLYEINPQKLWSPDALWQTPFAFLSRGTTDCLDGRADEGFCASDSLFSKIR